MDRDSLRKQLYEEIHAQFEARLREARRQKSELQEELELSEDKWRNERRRLNSEIDRLESTVAEAREARRKAPAVKSKEIDTEEIARLQAAADEKIRKAEQIWAAERTTLRAEVSRLQNGIAEMIERSNNPLRSSQAEQDKLEARLSDALKARRQAEDALLQAKEEWEQEKVKLVGDMVKTQRSAVPPKAASKPKQDDNRVEQLERQLDEAIKSRDKQIRDLESAKEKLERELEKARQSASPVKGGPSEDVTRLKADLEEARAQAVLASRRVEDEKFASDKEKTNLEKQLRQATSTKNGLERELEKVRQELLLRGEASSNTASADAVEQVRHEYDERLQEMLREKDELSEELRNAMALLEEERNKISSSEDSGSVSAEVVEQLRQEYDERMQEMLHEKDQLSEELRNAMALLEEERNKISASEDSSSVSAEVVEQLRRQYDERMQDMIKQKTELSEELRNATSLLDEERDKISAPDISSGAIDAEVERIQDMIAGIAKIIDDPETELSTVIRKNVERAELDAYLRGILFSLGRGQGL